VVVEKIRELPEDVQKYIHSLEKSNEDLEHKIDHLKEELRLALLRKFGRSSEKLDPNQQELFEESESEASATDESEEIIVPSHKRKKVGRKPLDDLIPREEILHDLSDEEKTCGCGAALSRIGEDVREELEIIPEQVYVKRHVYPKYACRCCEGSGDEEKPVFRMAQAKPRLLPGSIASPALLAFILINKFTDHLPFYRQEKRFERIGAHISRQDMSNWTMRAYEVLKILEELFVRKIKEGPVIQMDETPVQVMKEPGRNDKTDSYMWLARGGPPESPLVYYRYHPRRNADFIKNFLEGFTGYLQSDGYKAYETALKGSEDIIHVGCLAHVRRKFHEASKASKKAGGAHIGLSKIQKIYREDEAIRTSGLDPEGIVSERRDRVVPLLDDFKSWLDEKAAKVRPTSAFGKALSYASSEWRKVSGFTESPHLTPDNNAAERAIRPFVVGRKNWLFSGSPRGANASCFFYSMIETAKANELNPYGYLKWVFETAPGLEEKDYSRLLPWNADRDEVSRFAFNGF
jgi:transposase